MCYGALSASESCGVCGRRHPNGPSDRCYDQRTHDEAATLPAELERYLATPEARFLSWLGSRRRTGLGAA
jgi:hypothetical protein